MTPEEFINKLSTDVYDTPEQVRADLMPIIQQEAEAFAEWIEENNWFKAVTKKDKWICFATDEEFTTSELYQEYLKRKEKL